jgi:cellulose synthase/poly-beta-1,6-N-acetylglucosamine synthase-like glycosyltransferase
MTVIHETLALLDWPGLDGQWASLPAVRWSVTILYLGVLGLVCIYGLHRYWLVWLFLRHRRDRRQRTRLVELPVITVQLPMFNEAAVAARVIDAACALRYPADRLQVQVLDDSTDPECRQIAARRVEHWRGQGRDIQYLHREHRRGYKAGALADALPYARGSVIALFDADFVPEADFLLRTVHAFADPKVGMVQARWDHLNRDDSLLTQSQAIFLDGHFIIEHTARNRAGRWINFNGTAGLWRREAIDSAGGWHADTLTEDVDLSYRAQLQGWEFVYLPHIRCPAELPPRIDAFKSQQHRWTKGSIQTARKLLPTLLRSRASLGRKVEAFFHLTSPMCYVYLTVMALLFFPAFYVNVQPFEDGTIAGTIWGLTLFALGTASAGVFYMVSQRVQRRSAWRTLLQLPVLMCIGIGVAVNNARGAVEALLGHRSGFVRTPKFNTTARGAGTGNLTRGPRSAGKLAVSLLELAMGLYMLLCVLESLQTKQTVISTPFLLLFMVGYFWVGSASLGQAVSGRATR